MRVAAVVPVKALGAAKSRLSAVLGEGERAALALWLLGRVVAAIGASGGVADVAVVSPDEAALDRARAEGAVALRQIEGDLGAAIEQGRRWAISLGAEALLVALGDLPLLTGDDVRGMIELALPPEVNRRGHGGHGGHGGNAEKNGSTVPKGTRSVEGQLAGLNPAGNPEGQEAVFRRILASEDTFRASREGVRSLVVLAPDRAGGGTNALLLRPPGGMPFAFGAGSYVRHLALAREHGVAVATYRAAGTAFDVDGPADLAELRAGGLWPLIGGIMGGLNRGGHGRR